MAVFRCENKEQANKCWLEEEYKLCRTYRMENENLKLCEKIS